MDEIEAVQGFSALGNKTRLSIFRLLVRAGENGAPIGHIGRELEIPLSTLAHHLDRLCRAGLVGQHKVGREVICTANFKSMLALTNYLTEKCCEGFPEEIFASESIRSPELAES